SLSSYGPRLRVMNASGHEHPLVTVLRAAAGLDKTEPPIERDVLGHRLVRVESDFAVAAPPRVVLGERDQPAAKPGALPVRPHRDIVEQQMVGLWQQYD